MKELEDLLVQHSFFKGLKEEYIKLIAGCGMNKVFNPGEVIAHEGSRADLFYIVRDGKIAIQMFVPNKGAITLQTVGPNDILGWSWLFPPHEWSFDIKAIEKTRVIALDGRCLRGKCEDNHDLGYELMKIFSHDMVKRLHAARMQILDVYKGK